MKIMLIGGAGFIGSYVTRYLLERNHEILIYDAFIQYISPLTQDYNTAIKSRFSGLEEKITLIRGDTRNKNFLEETIKGFKPEVIIQLAHVAIADITKQYTEEATSSIINGTTNILDVITKHEFVKKFIYISSSMIYGDFVDIPAPEDHPKRPKDVYGGMKLAGEEIVKTYSRRFGVNYIIIRPSAVYGYTDINNRVSGLFINNALAGKPLILNRGGVEKLDFTYVKDLAKGIVLSCESNVINETFNMTRGEGRSIKEFAEVLRDLIPSVKLEVKDVEQDRPLRGAMDISKAKKLLGYNPQYSIEDGIKETLQLLGGLDRIKIPLCRPLIDEEEKNLVEEVLNSGNYVGGEKTRIFEEEFAKYIGTKYALSFNSCTSALHSIIQVLGIKGKIAVPSFTFVASANAIKTAGCEPVFVDANPDTFNIDTNSLEEALQKYPDIEAIMVVHFAGQSCDMDKIMGLAEKYGVKVIEDSAETCGGEYKGRKTGSFSFGCFSFFPTKNMTTGEGGMITFNEDELVEKLKTIRSHGIASKKDKPWKRNAVSIGYNFRMGEINAAMGIAQLKKLEKMNKRRKEIASKYNSSLDGLQGITIPSTQPDTNHVYQMYIIRLDEHIDRDGFVLKLNEKGIGASVHFSPPVHLHQAYIGAEKSGNLEATEKISKTCVTLPIFPSMTDSEVERVCKVIKEVLN